MRSASSADARWNRAAAIAALLVAACGGDEDADEVTECSELADFAACVSYSGVDGFCLDTLCFEYTACSPVGCDDNGPLFPLADTNLRVCYGASPDGSDGTIPCPSAADAPACESTDYCGQDAQYGWDTVHAAAERFTITPRRDAEAWVTDNVTGLVWQQCTGGQAGADCNGEATRMNWHDAVTFCSDSTWAGTGNWRLPTSYELQSIVDYSTTSPAFDTSAFVNAPSKFQEEDDQWWIECVWSASDYARDDSVAWVLMSNSGDISEGSGTTYHLNDKAADGWEGCYVRCVMEMSPPEYERLQGVLSAPSDGDRFVVDAVSKRVWQGCSRGQSGSACDGEAEMVEWKAALAYCQGLSWAGWDDWRLPDIKELRSIVDDRYDSPAIDSNWFPNTPYYGPVTTYNIGQYWSSTARSYNSFALYVDFGTGFSHFYEQQELRHVRCVRAPAGGL